MTEKTQKTSSKIKLTSSNYYSNEANWQYQSVSIFKNFMKCEAAALAELKGEWQPERDQTPLLVGNYLHSYFESKEAHQEFLNEHGTEILAQSGKNKGKPKKDYQVGDAMIQSLANDEKFVNLYQGQKEVIVKGQIDGVNWMGKLDCFPDNHKYFADLKTTQDLHKKYWLADQARYGTFIEAYNYPIQMAVYQELIRQQYGVEATPLIVAVTKQDPPDKAIISIEQPILDFWLEQVKEMQGHIQAVKNGEAVPTRCGHCDYCRATKKLTGVVDMQTLLIS